MFLRVTIPLIFALGVFGETLACAGFDDGARYAFSASVEARRVIVIDMEEQALASEIRLDLAPDLVAASDARFNRISLASACSSMSMTIIATLLIYVGAIGSAFIGAMVMLAFSLGVVIPFILAALFLSRALPLLSRIQQLAPQIGLISMLVMIAFGTVLVTDNFHVVSDFIYPYLQLS